ncbi:hydroxysqualene dehydroxylase [Haloechinothrix halophila]|uniref:hydroxysqualene dehydroxylase n=1 Tax=Haloechinothrix halophila TaxID=1069073 RepID=UPI0003FEC93B|nr:FAD-dependent oxidoreductase [Haloechinothrix halophila]
MTNPPTPWLRRRLSRRDMLRMSAMAGATATMTANPLKANAALPGPASAGRRVAVLGGGMSGLAAAHELIERGFEVDVYEGKELGGKARSMPVPGTGSGDREPLPGEHGFRFFPGFYHHLPDTMRRIPFGDHTVYENLTDTAATRQSYQDGPDLTVPTRMDPQLLSADTITQTLRAALDLGTRIPPDEWAYFSNRIWVYLTSCDARRYGQWEYVSWWEYVDAENRSDDYQQLLARGLTRQLVAAKETRASARTIGTMAQAFLLNIMGRGNDGEPDRLLNGPTNEAWIDPWVGLLRQLGVRFHLDHHVTELRLRDGRITSATARHAKGGRSRIHADWFFCALPAEKARLLWSDELRSMDSTLSRMDGLFVDWMTGIQFYLNRPVSICPGHVAYMHAPWALTSINQAQFWPRHDFPNDFGDGTVVDCLSVDISDWDTPGFNGKKAKDCTAEEIAREVLAQLMASLNDSGDEVLRESDVEAWFLDPAITWDDDGSHNDEPLLINTTGSWDLRPTVRTALPNLFLAGDYVRTDVDLATMEGANESARYAVNALLETTGSSAPPAPTWRLYQPEELEPFKRIDEQRYAAGQPNMFEYDA